MFCRRKQSVKRIPWSHLSAPHRARVCCRYVLLNANPRVAVLYEIRGKIFSKDRRASARDEFGSANTQSVFVAQNFHMRVQLLISTNSHAPSLSSQV